MARQTFTEGQRVYVKRYGSSWHEAVVVQPEIAKRNYGSQNGRTYYVGVRYVGDKWANDQTWDIINNRQHIVDEATYQEQERQREAQRQAQERARTEQQARALERYRGYALRIVEVLGTPYPPTRVEVLARALFVDFDTHGDWAKRDRRAIIAKLTGDQEAPPSLTESEATA